MKKLIVGLVIAASFGFVVTPAASHAMGPAGTGKAALVSATNAFGYWTTYYARNNRLPENKKFSPAYVNAQIERYIVPTYHHRPGSRISGSIAGDMHLMNIPSGYRYQIDRYDGRNATETVRWLFGSNPHTPVVRLNWVNSAVGWKINRATYLRTG